MQKIYMVTIAPAIILITETYSQRNTTIAEYPSHGLQHKVQIIAGTGPLNEDGSPHIMKLTIGARMEDKMAKKGSIQSRAIAEQSRA